MAVWSAAALVASSAAVAAGLTSERSVSDAELASRTSGERTMFTRASMCGVR